MRVTYLDGRVEEVMCTPRAQVMAEEKFGGIGEAYRLRAGYYMAWAALNRAGREPADFEAFMDAIADVGDIEDEAPVDPTPVAAPTTTSLG